MTNSSTNQVDMWPASRSTNCCAPTRWHHRGDRIDMQALAGIKPSDEGHALTRYLCLRENLLKKAGCPLAMQRNGDAFGGIKLIGDRRPASVAYSMASTPRSNR